MLMLHRSLVLIAAAAAFQPAEAANPAFAAASKAHLESMDAYFTCAFAAIRASREKGHDSGGYLAALDRDCAAEERLLRERIPSDNTFTESLILAQDERWRRA